jgi:hypothetical protein
MVQRPPHPFPAFLLLVHWQKSSASSRCSVPPCCLPPAAPTTHPPAPGFARARPAAEIIMFDDVVVVYKFLGDLMFYVTGDQDENEVVLYSVLHAFYESINMLLR